MSNQEIIFLFKATCTIQTHSDKKFVWKTFDAQVNEVYWVAVAFEYWFRINSYRDFSIIAHELNPLWGDIIIVFTTDLVKGVWVACYDILNRG